MTLRVVTDSTADLPSHIAQELGITVVPLYINFGVDTYRDGLDLDGDEFYRRLVESPTLPTTAAPSPNAFAEAFDSLAAETDEIICVHISAKLSGTYNAALVGKEQMADKCHIEVIDSCSASMGCGLLAIAAAKAARDGGSLDQVAEMVRRAIAGTYTFVLVDSLEYLQKGGRIGKAQAFLGTILNVKPLLTVRDGEAYPVERVRTRRKALSRLCELVEELRPIEEMAILHSTDPDGAEMLAQRLGPLFPESQVYRARFGPVVGTYVGPGTLGIALRQRQAD